MKYIVRQLSGTGAMRLVQYLGLNTRTGVYSLEGSRHRAVRLDYDAAIMLIESLSGTQDNTYFYAAADVDETPNHFEDIIRRAKSL